MLNLNIETGPFDFSFTLLILNGLTVFSGIEKMVLVHIAPFHMM